LLAVVYDVQNTTKTRIQASLPVWRGYTHLRTSDFWVEKIFYFGRSNKCSPVTFGHPGSMGGDPWSILRYKIRPRATLHQQRDQIKRSKFIYLCVFVFVDQSTKTQWRQAPRTKIV